MHEIVGRRVADVGRDVGDLHELLIGIAGRDGARDVRVMRAGDEHHRHPDPERSEGEQPVWAGGAENSPQCAARASRSFATLRMTSAHEC